MQTTWSKEEVPTDLPASDEAAWALVVDDNVIDHHMAGRFVERATGLKVEHAGDDKEAVKVLKQGTPSIVLTDSRPSMCGICELVDHIAVNYPTMSRGSIFSMSVRIVFRSSITGMRTCLRLKARSWRVSPVARSPAWRMAVKGSRIGSLAPSLSR